MESGIYKISCNDKYYIGSSKDINKRWKRHINDLKSNRHVNIHLQRAFDKYGIENFLFEIVEICDISLLFIKEQNYLDLNKNGFNIGKSASGGDNLSNNPNRDDIIKRIKETINNNISNMSDKEKSEKWGKIGNLNPNYDNKWSELMKENSSKYQKNNSDNHFKKRKNTTNLEFYGEKIANEISLKLSKLASERIGDKNNFFGKKHTEESKDKIRKKRIGIKPTNRISLSINDIKYESYKEASIDLGIPVVTIRWRCLSDNPKFNEYFLI